MPHKITGNGLYTHSVACKAAGDSISTIVRLAGYYRKSDPSKLSYTDYYEALVSARELLGVGPFVSPEMQRKEAALDALDKFFAERSLFQLMNLDIYESILQFLFSEGVTPETYDDRVQGIYHNTAEFALNYSMEQESYAEIPDYIKHAIDWTKVAHELTGTFSYFEMPSMCIVLNANCC